MSVSPVWCSCSRSIIYNDDDDDGDDDDDDAGYEPSAS